jgi:osmoprotectant transport system ATP-binding protein
MAVCREFVGSSLTPAAGAAAVEFREVSFHIRDKVILDKLSFRIEPGETLVLLGRSGSGKTTALKLVNGLLFPSSGEVVVDGRPTTACNVIALRRSIGYVIQEVGLFPHFSVAENVGLVTRLEGWPPERIAARVRELLQQVGLDPRQFQNRRPCELSGGQRQRVGVARALAANPRLLLFDEPFGALDPVTRRELQDQFLDLRNTLQKTSIFVTHDVSEALRLGTRIALLDRGRLEILATPQEFLKSREPETRAFLACLGFRPQMNADEHR